MAAASVMHSPQLRGVGCGCAGPVSSSVSSVEYGEPVEYGDGEELEISDEKAAAVRQGMA